MKKSSFCYFFLFLGVIFLIMGVGVSRPLEESAGLSETAVETVEKYLTPGENVFSKVLDEIIKTAREKIGAIKNLFSNFRSHLARSSFDSSEVSILTSSGDGIIIDRGYFGAGNVAEPFKGLEVKVVIKGVPESWLPAVKKAFVDLGFPGLMTFSPAQETLLGFILLFNDAAQKNIDSANCFAGVNLLLVRLLNTPGYESIKKLLEGISPIIKEIIEGIKIKGEGMIGKLDGYYNQLRKLVDRPFPLKLVDGKFALNPEYKPNGSKLKDSEAWGLSIAVLMKTFLHYSELKAAFEKTVAGKEAATKLKAELEKVSEGLSLTERAQKKIDAIKKFNKALPGFDALRDDFLMPELAKLMKRLDEASKFKESLKEILNPFLGLLGLDVDVTLSLIEKLDIKPEAISTSLVESALEGFDLRSFVPDSF